MERTHLLIQFPADWSMETQCPCVVTHWKMQVPFWTLNIQSPWQLWSRTALSRIRILQFTLTTSSFPVVPSIFLGLSSYLCFAKSQLYLPPGRRNPWILPSSCMSTFPVPPGLRSVTFAISFFQMWALQRQRQHFSCSGHRTICP